MGATVVTWYIVDKLLGQLIKDEGYSPLRAFFLPKKTYKNRLFKIINDAILEFEKKDTTDQNSESFPFYQSEKLFELLNESVLFGESLNPLITKEFTTNPNIKIPTEEDLNTFYQILLNKVKHDKKLRKFHVDENYKEKIFTIHESLKRIQSVSNEILTKLNALTSLVSSTDSPINQLSRKYGTNLQLSSFYDWKGLDIYPQAEKFAPRNKLVNELLDKLKEATWLHLYGNVSIGKTQLAVLMSQHYIEKYFIDLTGIPPEKIFETINFGLTTKFKIIEEQPEQDNFLQSIHDNTLFVFDGISKISANKNGLLFIKSLLNGFRIKNIKIISTGNFQLPIVLKDHLQDNELIQIEAPKLKKEDVFEVLRKHGGTDSDAKNLSQAVLNMSEGHPAIVQAIARYISENKWDVDQGLLMKIFQGDYTQELNSETYERLETSIEDDDSRELLYRLKMILGPIRELELNAVSSVQPAIKYPYQKISKLLGLWVRTAPSHSYELSPLIKKVDESNLSEPVIRKLNYELGKAILSLSTIGPSDASHAILYFLRAKAYNKAGLVLASILGQLSVQENTMLDNVWIFKYWLETNLPPKMDLYIQSVIRYYQISLLLKGKQNITEFLFNDFEIIVNRAAKENIDVAHGFAFLSVLYSQKDATKCADYLLLALKHLKRPDSKMAGFDTMEIGKTMTTFMWSGLVDAKNMNDLNNLINKLTNLNTEQRLSSETGDLSSICTSIFCQKLCEYEEQHNPPDWSKLIQQFETIISEGFKHSLRTLVSMGTKYLIRIYCVKLKDFDTAIAMYRRTRDLIQEGSLFSFHMTDELGRQLFYFEKTDIALPYLLDAIQVEVGPVTTTKIETYLALYQIFGKTDTKLSEYYINLAYEFQNNNQFVSDVFSAKIIGELSISTWEKGDRNKSLYIAEKGMEKLLTGYKDDLDYQGAIIRYGHIVNYYHHIVEGKALPLTDGQPYVAPFRGAFLRNNDKLLEGGYYFDQRKFMLAFLMQQCFEMLGDMEMSKKWAFICISLDEEKVINPYVSLITSLNLYVVLERRYEEAILNQVSVLQKINKMNLDEELGAKLNEHLAKNIEGRPRPNFDDVDYFVFITVQYPIFLQFFWDYVRNNEAGKVDDFIQLSKPLLRYYENPSDVLIILDCLSYLGKTEDQTKPMFSIPLVGSKLQPQLKTLLYLIASLNSNAKRALAFHLGIIERLEMDMTSRGTSAAYIFLAVPFFIDFWKKTIEEKNQEFVNYDHLKSKGWNFIVSAPELSKLRRLFRVLCYHLEIDEPDQLRYWFEGAE